MKLKNKGQTVLEYILLSGLIGVMSIVTIKKFGSQIEGKFESAIKRINKSLTIR